MSKKSSKEQKNSLFFKYKNYIILIVIVAFSMGLTAYFCKLYNVYKQYQKEIPVIRGSLSEITPEDLEHYVIDNPSVVVYICTSREDTCRNFEKKLKKYVIKQEIGDEMIYLNLTDVDKDKFVSDFNKKYHFKTNLINKFPAFVYFENGKVESIFQPKKEDGLTIPKLKDYLDLIWQEEEETEESEEITENE